MKGRRIVGFTLVIGLMIALVLTWRRLSTGRAQPVATRAAPDLDQFPGLTEEEASSRRLPTRDEEREQNARRVRRDIWRSSTFSIFNMSMIGLAIVQTLLGDPLSALLTFAVFILNVVFNAAQQLYATGQVEKLLDLASPRATSIRDGRIRSVDVDEIVAGDVLVVGPGDEFLADGRLLTGRPRVFEIVAAGDESRDNLKREGDRIQSGSFCLQGRAVYQVTDPPREPDVQKWTPVQRKTELTPLQRIIARVLRLLLAIIAVFLLFLVLDMLNFPLLGRIFEADYRETASVFFSIAPSGLFFMIVATYALGSARLGELGALVRDSRAVESLAQVTVLCFSKTGTLTGTELHLDMIPSANGQPTLAESRVRQILGDMAHSTRSDNVFLLAISSNIEGSRRPVDEEARYYSAYGWSGVTFSETDVRGTYCIGEPEILSPYLATEENSDEEDESATQAESGLRGVFGRFGRLFNRDDQVEEFAPANENTNQTGEPTEVIVAGPELSEDVSIAPAEQGRNILRRIQNRLTGIVQQAQDADTVEDEESVTLQPQLLFAYSPEPVPLFDGDGRPQLTEGLIPLCTLTINEEIRPEAKEAVQAFTESGVRVKILSSDDLECVKESAEQLGLLLDETTNETAVSGPQLSQMVEREFEQTVREAIVFSQLTSRQKGEIVRNLLRQGERVAMIGDAAGDVTAMGAADLSLTLQNGSQAALSMADIVLLDDSFKVLPTILDRGQRVVNGMLDILKINLVQIGYVLLLILAMFIEGRRIFYYHPTQGGVVVFITVIVPSLGLTLWASSGAVPRQYMRSRMVHFVVPAAVTMAAATLAISTIFGRGLVDIAYSQLAVAQGLVLMGLIIIIFVQPPTRFWVGGDVLSGDWRNTYMAIGLLLVFILATILPLTQELFRLTTLQDAWAYAIIGAVTILWTFLVRAIWRAPWLNRYVGIVSERLEKS